MQDNFPLVFNSVSYKIIIILLLHIIKLYMSIIDLDFVKYLLLHPFDNE